MKKVFLAVLVVFFASAVYAGTNVDSLSATKQSDRDKVYKVFGTPQVQFDLSGEFDARGYYWDNLAIKSDDTVTHSYYKGYIDLFPKLKVGDTQLIMKIEMVDQNPGHNLTLKLVMPINQNSLMPPMTNTAAAKMITSRWSAHIFTMTSMISSSPRSALWTASGGAHRSVTTWHPSGA